MPIPTLSEEESGKAFVERWIRSFRDPQDPIGRLLTFNRWDGDVGVLLTWDNQEVRMPFDELFALAKKYALAHKGGHPVAVLRETGVRGAPRIYVSGNTKAFEQLTAPEEFTRGTHRVRLNPLSSWTVNPYAARFFATNNGRDPARGVILRVKVPAELVHSLPFTGLGCLNEGEVVLLGGEYTADVIPTAYTGGESPEVSEELVVSKA